MITLLRNSLTSSKPGSTHEPLTLLHRSCCLDVARDMIRHIHRLFKLAPRLRRWSYYCFYCLQSTLVLLSEIADHHHHRSGRRRHRSRPADAPGQCSCKSAQCTKSDQERQEDWDLCNVAVEIFEKIELKASKRCAEVVRQFLTRWDCPKPQPSSDNTTSIPSGSLREGILPQSNATPAAQPLTPFPSNAQEPVGSPVFASEGGFSRRTSVRNKSQVPCEPPGSVVSADDATTASPPVSLSGLQAELYGAFYDNDQDAFGFDAPPPPLLGSNDPTAHALGLCFDVVTDLSWLQSGNLDPCNVRLPRDWQP